MIRHALIAVALALPVAGHAQQPAPPAATAEPVVAAPAPSPAPAAAPPAKAAAAQPLVTIYGTLNINVQLTSAKGATKYTQTVTDRYAVSPDSSNLGFKGGLELNPLLGIVYQCETSAAINGLSVSGICNRNSRLGVTGVWGTLFFGNWDTPYKASAYGTKADDPFLNTDVFGFDGLMSSPGFNYRSGGWVTAAAASSGGAVDGFDVRANSIVAYHSPVWKGLSGKVAITGDSFKNASGTQDPKLYGGVVNYDTGPVSLLVAYERHDDGFGLTLMNGDKGGGTFDSTVANDAGTATVARKSRDQAWRFGAGFEHTTALGTTTLGGLFERLQFAQKNLPVGAVKSFTRPGWQVSLKHRLGNHELRARYDAALAGACSLEGGAHCSTSGYGATEIAVGYAYYLAAKAQLYLHYARIENQQRAQYTFPIGGASAVAGSTPAGANPQALGLGLRYAF